jgi:hypothetical protein
MGNQGVPVGLVLVSFSLLSFVGIASAQTQTNPADAGDAVVVDPVNVNRQLAVGDSTSAFTFRLPEGASCPGDSANDDWRVQSFLVPAETDIGALRYRASRPDGEEYRSLRYLDGDIFAMELTNPNPAPGMPGEIVALPPMTFAWFPTGSVQPGLYKMGIACTEPSWQVERFWDVTVELESAPEVEPGGLRWRVVEASGAPSLSDPSGNGGRAAWYVAAFVVVLAACIVLVRRRNRRRVSPRQKESL